MGRISYQLILLAFIFTDWARVGARAGQLYVTDQLNAVYIYDTVTKARTTFASGGDLSEPTGLAFTPDGSSLFVANLTGSILRYNVATGMHSIFATGLGEPFGLAVSPNGTSLYVADEFHNVIVKYDIATKAASIFATGDAPTDLSFTANGNSLYASFFAGGTGHGTIRLYNVATGSSTLFANLPTAAGLALSPDGRSLFATDDNAAGRVVRYDTATMAGINFASGLNFPLGLALTSDGSSLFVANQYGPNGAPGGNIKLYDVATGSSSTFATEAHPAFLALSPAVVPEPSTLALASSAMLIGIGYWWCSLKRTIS